MKERPILFSGDMVNAILQKRKRQTRRIINPQPVHAQHHVYKGKLIYEGEHSMWCWKDLVLENIWDFPDNDDRKVLASRCIKGKNGDGLWVKETAIIAPKWWNNGPECRVRDKDGHPRMVQYLATNPDREAADDYQLKATPSIFMPRWASRISLDIEAVRVNKLQEISEDDAIAEGVEPIQGGTHLWRNYSVRMDEPDWFKSPVDSFRSLWELINGEGSWSIDPFVWAISFKDLSL